MTIATGALLVLLTWLIATLAFVTAGLLAALSVVSSTPRPTVLRTSMWWGLLITSVFAVGVNVLAPLASAQTAIAGLAALLILGVPGWLVFLSRRSSWPRFHPTWGTVLLIVSAVLVTIYLAAAALGPVTNYDSGLYHLGAIRYASEYAAIPGLANLYFPFGYGTSQFPLAALLTNGPWGLEGYRLLNGLILSLAAIDLILRMFRRHMSPGFFVLAAGMVATWIPMVALSDYWVTSPSQDSAALTLTIVASAYLADAVHGRNGWVGAAATAVAIGGTVTMIRPTMGAYLIGLLVIIAILLWRRRPQARALAAPIAIVAIVGAIALAVTTARDRILSGWAQYPLTVLPFDVPWRAADPTLAREATLGYHRNPEDLWNSIDGWNWVGPWLAARIQEWETYELLALVLAAVVLLTLAVRRAPHHRRLLMATALTVTPSVVATVVWWVATPPSYRFAWGALFTLATIPIGWALWSMRDTAVIAARERKLRPEGLLGVMAIPVLLVVAYSALFRLDTAAMDEPGNVDFGMSIPVTFAPVINVPVSQLELASGVTLLQPTQSDQCWNNYPLCTPAPQPNLTPIEDEWPQGLTLR